MKHEIEKQALENDFDADALEGWNELSAAGYSMKNLDTKFSKNYATLLWSIALIIPVIIIEQYQLLTLKLIMLFHLLHIEYTDIQKYSNMMLQNIMH